MLDQHSQLRLDLVDLGLELGAVVMLVLVAPPGGEQPAGQFESLLAEGLLLRESFGVATKVSL